MTELRENLRRLRLLPVIIIKSPERAVSLARALSDGGLPAAEITLRTPQAIEALRRIAGECPDVYVGAGTVLTPRQVDDAHSAGARFVVAPGFNRAVVSRARELGIPAIPGICTPTELEAALEMGLTLLKFFPATPMGGVDFLRVMAAPYDASIEFTANGGITPENVREYLAFDRVIACGALFMAPPERIDAGDFDFIRSETIKAVTLVGGAVKSRDAT